MYLVKKIAGELLSLQRNHWIMLTLLGHLVVGCTQSDEPNSNGVAQPQNNFGNLSGLVSDEAGNVYPGVPVSISKGSETLNQVTDAQGKFQLTETSVGRYDVAIKLPLSTKAVSGNSVSLNVIENQDAKADFVIQPQAVKAHLNFGNVQLLKEIVDKNGNVPTAPDEPLYAANIFDPPIGLLTAIKAPDGHHITLAEFQMAKGNLNVHCNGNKAFVNVSLEGMIPNGTYTFWLAYLNKTRKVGESINFMNDFVYQTNPPIGASNGKENIAVADANGVITITLEHHSCILTDEVALVIPILYHINGKTFGGGHVPDPEEMVHMLAYFQ